MMILVTQGMAHPARVLIATAQAERLSSQGSFTVTFQQQLQSYTQLPLLDSVFQGFRDTNTYRQQHYPFDQVLAEARPAQREYLFEHDSSPCLATVVLVNDHDYTWVHLKLRNNGFRWASQPLGLSISDTWAPQDTRRHFPALTAAAEPYFSSARIFYNCKTHSVDIKFYPKPGQERALLVTFEAGYPYMDDDAELREIP
jgi:hypothetical protein